MKQDKKTHIYIFFSKMHHKGKAQEGEGGCLMLIPLSSFTACESLEVLKVCILISLLTERPFHNWVYC